MDVSAHPLEKAQTSRREGHSVVSVLLLDDNGHHSHAVAGCLGQVPSIQLHVLSNEPRALVRFSRYCNTFHLLRGRGDKSISLDQVTAAIRATNAQIFLPTVESGIRFAEAHRAELEKSVRLVPIPDPDALEIVSNKYSLARFLARNGLPSPETQLLISLAELERNSESLSFPILLKPALGSGGFGIRLFKNRTDLLNGLRTHPCFESPHILQTYVPGCDLGCSFLSQKGKILALTIQRDLSRRDPFGASQVIQFAHHKAALKVIGKLAAALGWSGVAHVDLRCDERDRPFVIDFNPRYWQSLLGSLAAGVNFPHLSCLAALGTEFSPPEYQPVSYFSGANAIKHIARGNFEFFAGKNWKSGFRYAVVDPGPRAIHLLKKVGRLLACKIKEP